MDLTGLLGELVDIPSPTGDEGTLARYVADRLDPVAEVSVHGNAVVARRNRDRPRIDLYGHLDTVPEQGNLPARIDGGRLHGLGASDMKAGLAVMIALVEDDAVTDGPYDLAAVFYDREEGPAHENGLEAVLDAAPFLTDAALAVVMEPTDNEIQLGCQGALNATVRFTGRSAHSARPWHGENAVTKAGAWLAEMHTREPVDVTVAGLRFRETFAVTTAAGGIARNVIPAAFEVNLNHRFPPDRTLEQAEERLRRVCAAADDVEIVDRAAPAPIPEGNPHLDRLIEVSGAIVTAKQAWTDVSRLAARGVPALNYGPGDTALAHRRDESVALAALDESFTVLKRFLTQ